MHDFEIQNVTLIAAIVTVFCKREEHSSYFMKTLFSHFSKNMRISCNKILFRHIFSASKRENVVVSLKRKRKSHSTLQKTSCRFSKNTISCCMLFL